jgi:hypothetical protein
MCSYAGRKETCVIPVTHRCALRYLSSNEQEFFGRAFVGPKNKDPKQVA